MDPFLHLLIFEDPLHLNFLINLVFCGKIVEVVPKLFVETLEVYSLCCLNGFFDVLGEKNRGTGVTTCNKKAIKQQFGRSEDFRLTESCSFHYKRSHD